MTKEGTVLDGKYEILKKIGSGGMSIVYLARDNRLNKQWAVKEMKNDGSKDTETLLKGLEREANILKNVDHPVLPRIVDIINNKGTIYVVMDFIEGTNILEILHPQEEKGHEGSLAAFKKDGKIRVPQKQEDVINWGRQLASALDYLHSMTPPIIYRDMKPANVMLKPDGSGVKLIDFGTAKEYRAENVVDTTALGTVGYAAPEQFGDKDGHGLHKTDARTDIYNLGATMYHMVTGYAPNDKPFYGMKPIREIDPQLSSGLEQIILKCTAQKPEDRYQNCSELIYALDHYTEQDESFIKENKKKMAVFAASAGLTVLAGILSVVGFAGMKRVESQNYTAYIDKGNSYKVAGAYKEASDMYKAAMDLKGQETGAYVNFIDLYIDESNDPDVAPEEDLDISDGLKIIANRVNDITSPVCRDDEVLYRLGLAYFTEISDYQAASVYFNRVDKNNPNFGELAQYYYSISLILSKTNVNVGELVGSINGFADYTMNKFSNAEEQKFINYRTLGRIYTTYLSTEGIPEKAAEVMERAIEDLASYSGSNSLEYDYDYNDALSEIYFKLGEYDMAVRACQEVISQAQGRLTSENNESARAYVSSYSTKMLRIAEIYGIKEDPDRAIGTYVSAEKELQDRRITADGNLAKIYAAHLNFLYNMYISTDNTDPSEWSLTHRKVILAVYDDGTKVSGINDIPNWFKRVSDMEMLKKLGSGTASTEAEDGSNEKGE